MKYFINYSKKDNCWWCGSDELTGEHKQKKTDLELLYGKVYSKGNSINHIKYKTESKGINIQSSGSNRLKFDKVLCKNCNGTKSQAFDLAYQKLIEFYYANRNEIIKANYINLEKVYGSTWRKEYLNVVKYIGKHIGCRMAEIGLKPTENLIAFLNGRDCNYDLKVKFQIKPYKIGTKDSPIDSIFLGPAIPVNNSKLKFKNLVTSYSGWYTFANFTWNYLLEENVARNTEISNNLHIDIVDYKNIKDKTFHINEESLMVDYSNMLEFLEYYAYSKDNYTNIEHYNYMKNI